jgi:hypothetical protein
MPLNAYVPIEVPSSIQQQNDAAVLAQLLQTPQYTNPASFYQSANSQLAQALRNKQNPLSNSQPTQILDLSGNTTGNGINPATGLDWSQTGSGYAGDGGASLDNSGFLGNFNSGLDSFGNLFDGWGSSIGDFFSGIGDWFGSSAAPAISDAGAEIAPAAEEAAPAAAAAA